MAQDTMTQDTRRLWNADYIKVMATNFLLYFAFFILTPLLPLYLSERFGATKDVIGIVLSGRDTARYCMAEALGRWRKPVIDGGIR